MWHSGIANRVADDKEQQALQLLCIEFKLFLLRDVSAARTAARSKIMRLEK